MPRRYSLTFSLYRSGASFDSHEGGLAFDVQEVASLANALPTGRLGDLQIPCHWTVFETVDRGAEPTPCR
ncbi:MAG: hypothetical protein HC897_19290 [Thermoanaerobaculia bacterium]|nr:hypothetical protein [Thermoanaerobaculia bacterium]